MPLGCALASEGGSHIREQVTGTGGVGVCGAFRAAELVRVGAAELPQVRTSCKSQKVNFYHPQRGGACCCPVAWLASALSLCAPGTEGGEKGSSEVGRE